MQGPRRNVILLLFLLQAIYKWRLLLILKLSQKLLTEVTLAIQMTSQLLLYLLKFSRENKMKDIKLLLKNHHSQVAFIKTAISERYTSDKPIFSSRTSVTL
jgi:hypothetical protein